MLAGDYPRLKRSWVRAHPEIFQDVLWHPVLLACIGDLRPREGEPIERLIQTVSSPDLLFGPRYEAMLALGKIGAPAGPRAVQGIRATVHDRDEALVEVRERVVARIETPLDAWLGCPRCYWGHVPGRAWSDTGPCSSCLGLGVVARGLNA